LTSARDPMGGMPKKAPTFKGGEEENSYWTRRAMGGAKEPLSSKQSLRKVPFGKCSSTLWKVKNCNWFGERVEGSGKNRGGKGDNKQQRRADSRLVTYGGIRPPRLE